MSVAAGGVARSGLTALLALTLGALLLSSASPAGAQSGSGTVDYDTDGDNLIEVSTLAQLNAIRYDLDGNGTVASGDQANYDIAFPNALASMGCAATCTGYELTADLTFDENGDGQMTSAGDPTYWNGGSGWAPLGGNALPFRMDIVVTMFAGILEGNGHTISHLYINRPDHIAIGLFGVFRNPLSGVIRNLTLANVNVTGQSMVGPLVGYVSGPLEGVHVSSGRVSGVSNVGGLVGTVFRLGHVSGSHSAAAVTGAGANADLGKIGGLVGELYGKVTTSYATGSVTGPHVVGGLVGSIEIVSLVVGGFAMGEVNRSYATGAVSAPGSSAGVGGGLAGANAGHVKASYATGAVSGRGPIGGLIGNNKGTGVVTASYARGKVVSTGDKGGLTGQNSGTVTNSYWDTEATGQATIAGDGVGGQTRSALQTPTDYTGIYANWNLNLDSTAGADNPWDFGSNAMYPALKADFDGDGTPTSTEFGDSPVSAVPAFTEGAGPVSRSVPENTEQKADKNIGLPAGAEDANNQDTLTYTLDGTNAAHFDIDASSGRLQAKGALDFEGTPNYQVIVRVRDGRDALASVEDPPAIDDTIVVDISVTDVNEPPEFGVVGPFTPDENQTAVGTVPAAVDPDAGASLTYEIMEGAGDGDHALFDFNVGTRVLTFEKAPDYEATPTKITYTVKIRVKDGKDAQGTGGSLWDNTVTVTINLQNVNEPPDAPTNVGAVGIANGLRVTWTAPVITVEPAVDGYDVEYSLRTSADGVNPATWGAPTTSVAGVVTTHDILTLTPRSTYRVRVRAENDDGKGDWSSYVNGVPNDPPLINAVPSFDDGADTTRSVPENTAAGTAIGNPIAATDADAADTLVYAIDATSGDHAHFDIDTSTGQLEVKGALDYEAVKNSYTVTVQVRDSLNAAGTADTAWDASIEVTIAVDDANEKPAFAGNADTTPAVAEGATAVGTYAATDPESDSLTYGLSGTDAAAFGITGAGALSLTSAADHEAQSSYSVNVRVRDSRNADGAADTAWDTTLALDVGVTDADEKPDAPTGVGAAGIANGLRVTWKAPDMARKPALEGYDVEHALRTAAAAGATPATWGAAATGAAGVVEAYEVTGLTPGSTYRVRVRARNDEGDSVWTPYVTGVPTTPPLVNAVPSFDEGAGTTRGVPENTAAGTAIGLPLTATDTDSDTLTYAIDSPNVSPGSHFGIDSATGQLKARGALNYESGTTSYAITVTVSDGKSGTDSIAVTITVDDVNEPPDRPAAPTVSPASTSSLNVRWSAPANKGPAITDYDHRYKKTSENSWTEVTGGSASTALTAVIASLESGASYDVQVRATNLEGTGDWSAATSATTAAATAPGAPTGLTAAANGQTQIDLSWTAPASSGGAAISGYKLEVSADAGSTWSGLEDDTESTTTTHEHSGLTAGTTRHYRVSAINSAGTGATSSVASATTAPAGVPGAPTGLGATANGQMQIDLSWTAPAGTGGAPISGYKIEVSDDAGNTWSGLEDDTESTSTTHTHSGLTAGTTRHYRVSAINSGGTGAASSAASATTDAAAGVPGAPTGLTAAANGQTQIDLAWTAPASSGGAAISGYKLEVSADAGSTWSGLEDDTESTSTTHEHTGLTAGTTRHYRVSAINSAGAGAASSVVSATTEAPAAAPPAPPVSLPAGGGGGGTGAAGPTPSTLDFEWNMTRDIEALDAGNDLPSGLWSDGETLWVAQNSASVGDAVYAYDLAGGERLPEREFELAGTNRAPRGIWSDGETMWVADSGRDRLFAHDLASGERLPERDLELDARNGDARGIWSGGEVLWALDGGRDRLFAYELASGALLAGYALDPANGDPRGLWSDGVTLWVSDHGAKRLFAYRLPRVEAAAEALARVRGEEFTELTGAGNNSPRGIWSGGEVMYVADANDGKVYSYNMPDAADARLASLTLGGVDFGEFASRRTEYEGVAAGGVAETTVEARAVQSRATVAIAPPDADGNAANGHQAALQPGAEISVTVTSADGSRTRSYRVRFGSADEEQEPWPDCLRGDIATGFSLVVYEGGGVEQLESCARGLHVTALYVPHDGRYVSSILDAPAFVNQPFRELFPDGLAPVTPLLVASGGPAAATDPDAARLASLTLSGVAIGEFSGSRTQYAGVAGEGVTQTTVVAAAVQGAASILIEPADAAGDALNGHQVALEEGRTAISVTVTAADGSRTRVYRVWIGGAAERREPSPQCLRGEIATGFGLVVYEGGSLEELEACARSLSVVALYVLDGGEFVPLLPGAPAFVNRPFRELFPHGLPPATPLFAAGDGP